jgi:hypothetical protein
MGNPMKLSLLTLSLPTRSLTVGRDAESFRVGNGPRVDLRSLGSIRRVFRLLVETHCTRPGQALSIADIFDVAWFGEEVDENTLGGRRGRVYTVLSKLRKMGLESVLRRTSGGYHLDAGCLVITEGSLASAEARLAS